jgi:hypothetical protein
MAEQIQTPATVQMYRVENPTIQSRPNGVTSHEDLVGQWFTPNLNAALVYLRKSTQTFGQQAGPIDGAQLVVARVSVDKVEDYHVAKNPTAAGMDVEQDNYLLPRDGSISIETLPLDDTVGELRGKLGNLQNFTEAKRRVIEHLGGTGLTG